MTTFNIDETQNLIKNAIKKTQKDQGYQDQILYNYQQLFNTVAKQNAIINTTYYDYVNLNSADAQQSKYVYQSSTILAAIYTYGFYVYMVVAAILCGVILMKPFSIYYKIALVIAILGYPYYIYTFEEWSYIISMYIWNLLTSVVHNNGYGNMSLEYGLEGGGDTSNNNAPKENPVSTDLTDSTSTSASGPPPAPTRVQHTIKPPPFSLPEIGFSS